MKVKIYCVGGPLHGEQVEYDERGYGIEVDGKKYEPRYYYGTKFLVHGKPVYWKFDEVLRKDKVIAISWWHKDGSHRGCGSWFSVDEESVLLEMVRYQNKKCPEVHNELVYSKKNNGCFDMKESS